MSRARAVFNRPDPGVVTTHRLDLSPKMDSRYSSLVAGAVLFHPAIYGRWVCAEILGELANIVEPRPRAVPFIGGLNLNIDAAVLFT